MVPSIANAAAKAVKGSLRSRLVTTDLGAVPALCSLADDYGKQLLPHP